MPPPRRIEQHPRRLQRAERLENPKVPIPNFQGESNAEAYLEWEMKVEQLFTCHELTETQKVRVTTLEFTNRALLWWNKVVKDRERYGEPPVNTWEELRRLMRRKYVPPHYMRELHNRVQWLKQGSRTVSEHYSDMETATIKANLEEESDATMARFLRGLNPDVREAVEMHEYEGIEEMVHQALKIEQQHLRKQKAKRGTTSSNFEKKWTGENKSRSYAYNWRKPNAPESKEKGATSNKQQAPPPNIKSQNVKCSKCLGHGHIASQCPTKKVSVLNVDGEVTTDEEPEPLSSSEEEGDKNAI